MNAPDVQRIQGALAEQDLDGWLLYDYRGRNPVAVQVAGLTGAPLSRRWFLLVPRSGEPTLLRHALDRSAARHLAVTQAEYTHLESLHLALGRLLAGGGRFAMEYSPGGGLPAVSHVDGGTLDLVRSLGAEVMSSADLAQHLLVWTLPQLVAHRAAAAGLTSVKDAALAFIDAALRRGQAPDELEVQAVMVAELQDAGLRFDHPPIVAFGRHSSDPHYAPDPRTSVTLRPGEAVLLDLWGKGGGPADPYADITWMGVYGSPTAALEDVFSAVLAARDHAVDLMSAARAGGWPQRGFEVDRAVQTLLAERGYAAGLLHRTGHSLGIDGGHGHAVHLDDFESHDDRLLLTGLGLTVEPGVYLPEFGVRSEIDVYLHDREVEVTSAVQRSLDVVG